MISGLILAAGESSRMKTPKALLTIGKITFTERIVFCMQECDVDPVYVVAGAHFEEIRLRFVRKQDFSILNNTRYQHGQLSSLKEGLRQLPTGAEAVLVWPVDIPLVRVETVQKLVDCYRQTKAPVIIPQYRGGRHGHPVIYGLPAIQTILSLRKDQTAKDVRAIHEAQTVLLDVEDPGVLIDIDTPEDYQNHIAALSDQD